MDWGLGPRQAEPVGDMSLCWSHPHSVLNSGRHPPQACSPDLVARRRGAGESPPTMTTGSVRRKEGARAQEGKVLNRIKCRFSQLLGLQAAPSGAAPQGCAAHSLTSIWGNSDGSSSSRMFRGIDRSTCALLTLLPPILPPTRPDTTTSASQLPGLVLRDVHQALDPLLNPH